MFFLIWIVCGFITLYREHLYFNLKKHSPYALDYVMLILVAIIGGPPLLIYHLYTYYKKYGGPKNIKRLSREGMF